MADDAYERLRTEIVSGRLQPNERLVEADIVSSLGVSRTAVRAALVRLEHDGLVEHERNRGAKVRLVGESEAIEILETRAALEGLIARKAAANVTEDDVALLREILASMRTLLAGGDLLAASDRNVDLHGAIMRIARHRTAERLVSMLNSQLVRFQYRTILQPGRSERTLREHEAIVEAMARGDGAAAETAMRAHLAEVAEALRAAAGTGA